MGTLKLLCLFFPLFVFQFAASDKACDDVVCTKDCKLVDLPGQCAYCRCEEDKSEICKLKLDKGKGKGHHERYFYSGGWCKEFSYKGEGGNKNNFATKEACEKFCSAEDCPQLNCEHGCIPVYPLIGCPFCECSDCPRLYCSKDCKTITPDKGCAYCECDGKKCKDVECGIGCQVFSTPGTCPRCDCSENSGDCAKWPSKGVGSEYLIRYYHEEGKCKTFLYSGKGGNANRFLSKEDCEKHCGIKSCNHLDCDHGCEPEKVHDNQCPKKCICEDKYKICHMPIMEGFGKETWKRYYFDSKYGVCEQFYFKGKGGNYNNFKNKKECEDYCSGFRSDNVCTLEKDHGKCHKYEKRFYYDYKDYKCKVFTYGGCYGNGNNFITKEECERTCKSDGDVCTLPKDNGPCFGHHKKFYYDPEFDECSIFYYGGCYGNKNRFDTQAECEFQCKQTTSKCDLKPDKGSCNGQHRRYYFSKPDAECKEFYYGGCEGNLNNFKSKYECEHECLKNINKCELDPDAGNCYGNIRRYYYNKNSEECAVFQYSGCDGNANNFKSKDECEIECKDQQDICTLKPDKGPCHERKRRWYYSEFSQSCEQFYYGGCDGNDNNFETKAACQKRCAKIKDVCQLSPDKGPCHGYIQKYYYNKVHKKCEHFIYGGCKGNGNNFDTMEHCEKRCLKDSDICNLKADVGPCEAAIRRYFYNVLSGKCETFIYGGCLGNANNFASVYECKNRCHKEAVNVCQLNQDKGPCYGKIQRYYYNSRFGKCEKFLFGGCEGNGNNFKSMKDCEKRCGTRLNDVCEMKPDGGPCRKRLQRWFFNSYEGQCKEFHYGGCGGNANNFQTKAACRRECGSVQGHPSDNPCELPPSKGPCYGHIQKYYYDSDSGTCQRFVYGGCDGNGNNFNSIPECLDTCKQETSVCHQKPVRGNCYQQLKRYYYNYDAHICEEFTYSGCGGNSNNFRSVSECRQQCQQTDVCQQKVDGGNCKEKIGRYYFDQSSRTCRYFWYSGCGGNKNNFATMDDCQNQCTESVEDICSLPMVRGPCNQHQSRYFFNQLKGTCEYFTFGGCNGNANNFRTIADCKSTCAAESEPASDICRLSPVKGPCSHSITRYYYDFPSGTCKQFIFGGCNGNANNFKSQIECENNCSPTGGPGRCELKPERGPCNSKLTRYYFNSASRRCEQFIYSGCEGNTNNFDTVFDCRRSCAALVPSNVCDMPAIKGPCKGAIRKYFFNKRSGACEVFIFGGCEGNENNFDTMTECLAACATEKNVCSLPSERGPCYGHLRRYFYDSNSGVCRQFFYGGCSGNGNNFRTIQECKRTCHSQSDICEMAPEKGPCYGKLERYYFDSVSQKCQMFIYGGCEGNNNNFASLRECQDQCSASDTCALPKDKGTCYGKENKYYFNQETQKCEKFVFSGCGGNGNNFDSVEECKQQCGGSVQDTCNLPPIKGPCYGKELRYYFNQKSGKCYMFTYGGCQGNENNFRTAKECESSCMMDTSVCEYEADPGPCKATIERYFFNKYTGSCDKFYYGGCQGNENNFQTLKDCSHTCVQESDVCQLPPEKGPCYRDVKKFYFNPASGRCQVFTYGGCKGNENRFDTIEQCETTCQQSSDTCTLKPDKGPCYGRINRYYYNQDSGTCEVFIYGGCEGNGNRFATRTECERECKPAVDVCFLPKEQGPCRQKTTRYFHNTQTGRCEKFTYGGCQGNENNFETLLDCKSQCDAESTCGMSIDAGPCYGKMTRFGFDPTTRKCVQFTYGGCKGNRNNFRTMVDCRSQCENNVCELSPERGPCYSKLHRYFYSSETGTCERFVYGGCQGNGNNFRTVDDCLKECGSYKEVEDVCNLHPDKGTCYKNIERYFYNKDAQKCQTFVFGGCGGNANNFETLSSCQKECSKAEDDVCEMEPKKGPCKESLERYYYSKKKGMCEAFYYGGCGGNENRFASKKDCEKRCMDDVQCPKLYCKDGCWETSASGSDCPVCACKDDCKLTMDEGYGTQNMVRFYYDEKSNKCKKFHYRGQGGNNNKFISIQHCYDKCSHPISCDACDPIKCPKNCWPVELEGYCPFCACQNDCVQDKDIGTCKGKYERYYYNRRNGKCEQFYYGGCEGNGNHFFTKDDCEKRCDGANKYHKLKIEL